MAMAQSRHEEGALLIKTARGWLVDETALLDAWRGTWLGQLST
jgi:phosphoglycerate dehydrogenase-like enzyme